MDHSKIVQSIPQLQMSWLLLLSGCQLPWYSYRALYSTIINLNNLCHFISEKMFKNGNIFFGFQIKNQHNKCQCRQSLSNYPVPLDRARPVLIYNLQQPNDDDWCGNLAWGHFSQMLTTQTDRTSEMDVIHEPYFNKFQYMYMSFNSLAPSDAIWLHRTRSTLIRSPAQRASGFSDDHKQNHQCLWFHSCYNVTHVFCPSLFVFCWE